MRYLRCWPEILNFNLKAAEKTLWESTLQILLKPQRLQTHAGISKPRSKRLQDSGLGFPKCSNHQKISHMKKEQGQYFFN